MGATKTALSMNAMKKLHQYRRCTSLHHAHASRLQNAVIMLRHRGWTLIKTQSSSAKHADEIKGDENSEIDGRSYCTSSDATSESDEDAAFF